MSQNSTIRQRFASPKNDTIDPGEPSQYKHKYPNSQLRAAHFFALLGLMLTVLVSVIVIEKQLPPGLKISNEHLYPDRFIAERAYNILKNLTDIGPRVAGSHANEVLAVNLLKKEIQSIINTANRNHIVQLDIQKASGAFKLTFLDGMTNVYRNMQNVIVKIGSRIDSPHSLLINCHFDTVSNSPGGSDDGAGCAVMLEMLRVISKSDRILRHNIVFLFNGGEENILPASHGFITQHRWAQEIRAFINIEACGAGGREILFQAGPNHPWIIETYSDNVNYPYASSMAQEIFQSGIIPGDTDFRIFRDFGELSGLDFAWSSNGYVYHTHFDNIEQIPLGTLQRTGDNILALARGMAQGHQLAEINKHKDGNLVYFDFLGLFVVRWPMLYADIINCCAVIFSFYSIYLNSKAAYKEDALSSSKYVRKLISCMGGSLLAAVASIIVAICIALLLTVLGRTMSWFARPIWVFFLYVVPTMVVAMAILQYHARVVHRELPSWSKFRLYFDAYQLVWTITLILGIIFRIRSSVIALFWTVSPALLTVLTTHLFKTWKGGKWLLLYIGALSLPFVQCVYFFLSAMYLCIPIMGRAGSAYSSEIFIALLTSFLYGLLISFVLPLITLVRNTERIFSVLLGVFLLSLAVLILTPLGFPYSGDPTAPAPQRFMIDHTKRIFHDATGRIERQSTGYWIVDMDINSPHSVDRYVPEMKQAKRVDEDCVKYLYCGLPYLLPVQNFIFKTHWIEGPAPKIKKSTEMKIVKRNKIPDGERITISVNGPHHTGIMLSPMLGVDLVAWSLVEGTPLAAAPKWNDRSTYFIYYSYTGDSDLLQFSVDFKTRKRVGGRLKHASLPYSEKYLALLPKTHRLSELVVRSFHEKHSRPDLNTTSYLSQQNFWIISIKKSIRSYRSSCHQCFRARPLSAPPPIMGDLPSMRVNQVKPFSCVGVDFACPFSIKVSRLRQAKILKTYVCLFICFATKAVHIELVSDLSSEAFLAALRRFIARRGRCSQIFSDCGTNFVGASRQLSNLLQNAVDQEGIQWSFNLPSAPHFGGLWESGVKSVKTHLLRVVGDQTLTFEELYTVLVQIESLLNSRPLCPMSTDPNDLQSLTPGYFLTLEPLSAPPVEDLSCVKMPLSNRWRLLQKLHQDFWVRWSQEYLHTLYQRAKWNHSDNSHIAEDSLVVMKDDLLPPLHWKLGRIIQVYPGSDGTVRVALVKTSKGIFKRPIIKLCPLPYQ